MKCVFVSVVGVSVFRNTQSHSVSPSFDLKRCNAFSLTFSLAKFSLYFSLAKDERSFLLAVTLTKNNLLNVLKQPINGLTSPL